MITNSIWWDDHEYAVEGLPDGTITTTRITEDGAGLFTSLDETTAVTVGLDRQVA